MSILSWSFWKEDEKKSVGPKSYVVYGEPTLEIEFPTTDEAFCILQSLDTYFTTHNCRFGYRIRLNGSCAKGPQGVNWKMRIEFEEGTAYNEWLELFKVSYKDQEDTSVGRS